MKPGVADAIGVLKEKEILTSGQSATFLRVERRDLVSVLELRSLLYAGVLLAVSGVGLFLKENQDRIGPVAIAFLLAAAAAGCLLFVLHRSFAGAVLVRGLARPLDAVSTGIAFRRKPGRSPCQRPGLRRPLPGRRVRLFPREQEGPLRSGVRGVRLLLLFGGLLSGVFEDKPNWPLWEIGACGAAAAVIAFAYRFRRLFDFTIGVIAGYLALLRPWKASVARFSFSAGGSARDVLCCLTRES